MNLIRSKMYSKRRLRSREGGIALIAVLWTLLLLSSIAASAAFIARSDAVLAHRELEIAQVETTADAAIIETISRLSDEQVKRHFATDGTPESWEFDGRRVAITVRRESGRIDINTADDALLLAFLKSQGVNASQSAQLLQDLKARRARARLHSVDEIEQISSWRTHSLECWRNSLTVYSGAPGIDFNDAQEAVRSAVMSVDDGTIADRASLGNTPMASANDQRSVLGEVLRIEANVASNDIHISREWIGRLTADAHQPMLTMFWQNVSPIADARCNTAKS